MSRLSARMLPDGRRLYLHDGPIDLIVQAWGEQPAVAAAYRAARDRAASILDELCAELSSLRQRAQPGDDALHGVVARRMQAAVMPFAADMFITPMAAVAGAVAEEVLEAMVAAAPLRRAYVNDGGDIALHLEAGESLTAGLVDQPDQPGLFARALLRAEDPVRGIATSGWRGRSHSLGIADAVTVLAPTAPAADAAGTVVANAVDLPGHPAVQRVPAVMLDPDSDLGEMLVTRGVGALTAAEIEPALAAGAARAEELVRCGLICAAALHLQGRTVYVNANLTTETVAISQTAPPISRGRPAITLTAT